MSVDAWCWVHAILLIIEHYSTSALHHQMASIFDLCLVYQLVLILLCWYTNHLLVKTSVWCQFVSFLCMRQIKTTVEKLMLRYGNRSNLTR